MRRALIMFLAVMLLAGSGAVMGQGGKPKSPAGKAATQVGDSWIEISYGRPILRGRQGVFGEGESYGQALLKGAPIWRAGANVSTRLKTDVDLKFGDTVVAAGEYSLFMDLKAGGWTFIVSNHNAQLEFDRDNKSAIWGAYGYTPEKDVVRMPMTLETTEFSIDQLTIGFAGMTDEGGGIYLIWDNQLASVPFTIEN